MAQYTLLTVDGGNSRYASQSAVAGKYTKPSNGIPATDLTSAAQAQLAKADAALSQSQVDARVTAVSNASYATFPGARTVVLGNSVDLSQEAPAAFSRNSSWFNYASIVSGQRIEYGFNAGVAGNTTAQMLARFDADVAPKSPRVVVLGGAENDADPARNVTLATFAANMDALVAKCRGIGAAVVLRLTLPNNATGQRQKNISAINAWVRANAARLGAIAVLDFHTPMVDPATGGFKTVYDSGDGTHPNDLGNSVLGTVASNTLVPVLPANTPLLAATATDAYNKLTNGLFLGTLTGGEGDQPSGWYFSQGGGILASLVPATVGNAYRLTFSGTSGDTYLIQQLSGATVTAMRGHTCVHTIRLSTQFYAGMLGSCEVSADGTAPLFARIAYNMGGTIADGVASVKFTVPSDATVVNVAYRIAANSTGIVSLSQATLYDLTEMGI